MQLVERPLIDGFVHSLSLLYLPTTFRAHALAQMEVLRRATGYRVREYCVPDQTGGLVKAFGQVEQQINTLPGAYLWGLTFAAPFAETANNARHIYIQITDACTESPLFSDYTLASMFEAKGGSNVNGWNRRNPPVMAQPFLIGPPALLDVEIYNSAAVDITCQLVLLMAEPVLPPEQIQEMIDIGQGVKRGRRGGGRY